MLKSTLFILLIFVAYSFAQIHFLFMPQENDNRASAMGRTGIVTANGSNAIFSNPALLGTLERPQIQTGARMHYGIVDDELASALLEIGGGKIDSKYSFHVKYTHASFAIPFRLPNQDIKIAFGLGYNTALDFGYENKTEISGGAFTKTTVTSDASGGLTTISPALAANYMNKYSIGITYNTSVNSSITFEDKEKSGINSMGSLSENDISASFLTFGGYAQIIPLVGASIKYSTGYTINVMDGKYQEYRHGNLIGKAKEEGSDLKIPGFIGLGAIFTPDSNICIAVEYQNRPFSKYKEESNMDGEGDYDFFPNITNGSALRAGFEFKTPGGRIRAGIFKESLPFPKEMTDENEDKNRDPVSMTGFTLGFGLGGDVVEVEVFGELDIWSSKYEETGDKYKEKLFRVGAAWRINL